MASYVSIPILPSIKCFSVSDCDLQHGPSALKVQFRKPLKLLWKPWEKQMSSFHVVAKASTPVVGFITQHFFHYKRPPLCVLAWLKVLLWAHNVTKETFIILQRCLPELFPRHSSTGKIPPREPFEGTESLPPPPPQKNSQQPRKTSPLSCVTMSDTLLGRPETSIAHAAQNPESLRCQHHAPHQRHAAGAAPGKREGNRNYSSVTQRLQNLLVKEYTLTY